MRVASGFNLSFLNCFHVLRIGAACKTWSWLYCSSSGEDLFGLMGLCTSIFLSNIIQCLALPWIHVITGARPLARTSLFRNPTYPPNTLQTLKPPSYSKGLFRLANDWQRISGSCLGCQVKLQSNTRL